MADPMQLDKAAALVGKSEVTLRRLIKAGRIPFSKERTLTGFIYMVDPDAVRAYYKIRGGGSDDAADSGQPERPEPSYMPKAPEPVRIAVEDAEGHAAEYWQKRSDVYEDKYHQEVQKHAQTREELGMWRGRAEQAQSMVIKMLPPPETPAIPEGALPATKKEERSSWVSTVLWVIATVILCASAGGYFYVRYLSH